MPATVSLLPPPPGLLYAHHGTGSGPITLDHQAGQNNEPQDSACGPAFPQFPATGRKFHNPWPSYRFMTVSDAMLAYQRGAAIAKPQLPERNPVKKRSVSRASTLTLNAGATPLERVRREPEYDADGADTSPSYPLIGRHPADDENNEDDEDDEYDSDPPTAASWLKPDEPEDAAEEDDEESLALDGGEQWSFQHPPGQPVNGYVRPTFSRILTLDEEDDWREPPIRVERPTWSRGGDTPLVTWLGHAGTLVQIPWANAPKTATASQTPYCGVIFDPIFSYRCSPSQLVGPARHLDPPCAVYELPGIHVCCISHDHYDHLDYGTIMQLWECNRATIHFFVPLGLAAWFLSCGIPESRVTELDWWHEAIITFPSVPGGSRAVSPSPYPAEYDARIDPSAALTLKLACTPAQHRSGRGIFDHMTSLWGSWCVGVVGPGCDALQPGMDWDERHFKVYFGGDTGYRYATAEDGDDTSVCPAFAEIGKRYGPFTLALLPLSTGSSLPFLRSLLSLSLDQYTLTSSQHCSPADSLDIHLLLRARRSLGVHWGTFCDAPEARATRVEFGRARRDKGVSNDWDHAGEKGAFVIADIGLVMEVL